MQIPPANKSVMMNRHYNNKKKRGKNDNIVNPKLIS